MNTFKKADWINNTDVYEVNLRQYTKDGTFAAFMKELPRLKEMGVSTLWFMPITPIAQMNKKGTMGSQYACSDYTGINPEFGTLDDFKSLVTTAHGMGFKVILDWVANHTGWDHVWTKAHPEYYEKDHATGNFKIASGMDDIIELDFKKPELRKAMIGAMKYWVTECDIDGFRCDLASWVELDFWVEARTELEKTKTLFWLAECDGIESANYYQAFDACYTWTWMHKSEDFYKKGLPVSSLRDLLQQYNDAGNGQAIRLWFTSNHDENSWNGTEYEKYGDAARALAAFSFTWNGIPLIYSGQELPNRKRLQFFEKDPIEWNGSYELNDFYKTLLDFRKHSPALRAGDDAVKTYWVNTTDDTHVLSYLRKSGDNEVLVFINLSNNEASFSVKDKAANGEFLSLFKKELFYFTGKNDAVQPGTENLLTNKQAQGSKTGVITLKPWAYLILEKQ
ncbi:MAG: 1,4-alpha-glucan branching protein [Chitinophagaceae bacterium]|nr:1,4-alpha-glucan branching protein [Chitinophagaceae bacterium]